MTPCLVITSRLGNRVACEIIRRITLNGSPTWESEFILRCRESVTHVSIDKQRNVYLEGGYTYYMNGGTWGWGHSYHAYVPPKRIGKLHEIIGAN